MQKRAGARAKAGKVLPAVQGSELAKEWVTALLRNVTLSPEQRSYTGIYLNARRILRGLGRRSHVKKYRMTEAGMAWYKEDRLLRGLKL